MAYTATTWINGDSITSTLMNHAETQYSEAQDAWGRWVALQSADTTTTVPTGIGSFTSIGWYGTETPGTYAAEAHYDPDYWAAAARTRLVCKKAGRYFCEFHATPSDYAMNIVLRLRVNGTTVLSTAELTQPTQDGSQYYPQLISDVYDFAADDYLECSVAHDKGSDVGFVGGANNCIGYLSAMIIRV